MSELKALARGWGGVRTLSRCWALGDPPTRDRSRGWEVSRTQPPAQRGVGNTALV